MPFYGGPELNIEYTYVAVFPFKAEHPIGSGTLVQYKPGDPFPGEDWGHAAANLVEAGKAVRLAVNVYSGGSSHQAAAPSVEVEQTEFTAEEVNATHDDVVEFPLATGAGWYTLSDGTRVRGEDAANEAQAALEVEE